MAGHLKPQSHHSKSTGISVGTCSFLFTPIDILMLAAAVRRRSLTKLFIVSKNYKYPFSLSLIPKDATFMLASSVKKF